AIRQQSEKLAELSHTTETWRVCEYGEYLRIVNTETLKLLNHYWTQYSDPNTAFADSYRAAVMKIYKTHYKDVESPGFSRAAGPQAISINLFHHHGDWVKSFEQYWKNGMDWEDNAYRAHCNPLFA